MATMDTDPPSSSSRNDTAAAGPPPDDSSQNAMAASQNDQMAADNSSAGSQTAVNDGAQSAPAGSGDESGLAPSAAAARCRTSSTPMVSSRA